MRPKPSLTEQAYKKIRNKIICHELKSGTRIDDQSLSESLQIGRTPLREALVRLTSEKLLKNEPGKGFFVSDLGFSDVKSIMETAKILYRAVGALAPVRIQPNEIKCLEKVSHTLTKAMAEKDYLKVVIYNSKFHKIINDSVANPFLSSVIDNIESQYSRICYLNFSGLSAENSQELEEHYKRTREDHEKMIEALKNKNQKAMIKLVNQHFELFSQQLSKYINPNKSTIDLASIPYDQI
jgi:DNA-binding GntR family transcriptional regulator